jgi:tRNA modification GTPase
VDLVSNDTICALATPPGRGGIGIIRVSGTDAFDIAEGLTNRRLRHRQPRTLFRAAIVDNAGDPIDDVLLALFRSPSSYTGEDVLEIHAHGGPVPLRRILMRLYDLGARQAGPGEFTQRAFLNGRMDLAQAEAVADVIEADTVEAHQLALRQQSGRLSRDVEAIRDVILGILARIEASIDFPEDVGELDTDACRTEILTASDMIDRLLATADAGILYREGVKVVLAGRPNVGKSSLMNALLRTDRAIVTPIPGTTRDLIEEGANIGGIRVRIVDTAGVRETSDAVEKIGVDRTRASIAASDLTIFVVDATTGRTSEDDEILKHIAARPVIEVWNKADIAAFGIPAGAIAASALTGDGIDNLEGAIVDMATHGQTRAIENEGAIVTHSRHRHALRSARTHLEESLATIRQDLPADFISIDVRGALVALGEITGATATDDIINEIFSRFCIGK